MDNETHGNWITAITIQGLPFEGHAGSMTVEAVERALAGIKDRAWRKNPIDGRIVAWFLSMQVEDDDAEYGSRQECRQFGSADQLVGFVAGIGTADREWGA